MGHDNVDSEKSDLKGAAGILEGLLRKFRNGMHMVIITPLYMLCCLLVGMALFPGILLVQEVNRIAADWSLVPKTFAFAVALPAAYFIYGFSLLLIVPAFNFIGRFNLKAWRGPYYSIGAISWYIHNANLYLLRFTFLEFITPTPFANFFYQLMGMKIGRGTVINTTYISDPSLISMGEKVTIGGSVTIVGHYGQGGYLILAPVEIGDKATIGLKASIMGGAKIGKDAKVLPHSVVMPKTIIPDGETWGGVPARKINLEDLVRGKTPAA
jgi:acetyltransferase-like isoleucine patch superfamily enzyme